jgi:hypothetical protein
MWRVDGGCGGEGLPGRPLYGQLPVQPEDGSAFVIVLFD